jgi:YVTN family beta-propeller protein
MLKFIHAQKIFFLTLIVLIAAFSVTLYAGDISRTLYVINGPAETLSKMNMESGAIVSNIINTGQIPNRILTHNDLIYVVNSGTDNIMVIDPQNDGAVLKTIALEAGNNPWQMAFVDSNRAYVTNLKDNSVSVINVETGAVLKNIAVGTGPEGILIVGNRAYIANTGYAGWGEPWGQAGISVIDIIADSVIHTLDVPVNAQDLALAPDGKLHVVCTGNYTDAFGKIAIIDISAVTPVVTDTIDIGSSPGDIEITSSGIGYCVAWGDGTNGFLYSYNALADTVIHGNDDPILVGPNVSQLLYDGKENVLWIPYMTEWAGDGFVQKFDVETDSVTWTSGVLGNGTNALAILEAIITSIDDPFYTGQPDHFDLYQNYPNPFNPSTAISYQLPAFSQVEIIVYSISGQKVRTLVNERQTAGNYTISFDATGLSSGIYFYKLKAGNSTQIRRMVLIR